MGADAEGRPDEAPRSGPDERGAAPAPELGYTALPPRARPGSAGPGLLRGALGAGVAAALLAVPALPLAAWLLWPRAAPAPVEAPAAAPARDVVYEHSFTDLKDPARGVRATLDGKDLGWLPVAPMDRERLRVAADNGKSAGAVGPDWSPGRLARALEGRVSVLRVPFGDPGSPHRLTLEASFQAIDSRNTFEYDVARRSWHVVRMEQRERGGWTASDFGYDQATGQIVPGASGAVPLR